MCFSTEPTEKVDVPATAEEPAFPEIKFIDGEGNEIAVPDGFDLQDFLSQLLFGADPTDPDTYLLSNTQTGQRAFEYSPAGVDNDQQPTITFELFQIPSGDTVAALKFDAEEILEAQNKIAESAEFIEAGAPSGALLFTEAPLRALSQIAGEFADQVAAANAESGDQTEDTAAGNPAPEIPPVLVGGPDA